MAPFSETASGPRLQSGSHALTTQIEIHAQSRLHFGLLGWGNANPRQFGGVGLMVDRPGLRLRAVQANAMEARGPHAQRILKVAARVNERLHRDLQCPPVAASFEMLDAPAEHIGLGTGSQLSLAVAQCLSYLSTGELLNSTTLANLAGRGLRSGIGIHGFEHGGLIVDGGKRSANATPPMVARHAFPPDWNILLVIPKLQPGQHGEMEIGAFDQLPDISSAVVDRMCSLVLLGILPAVAEQDLESFGAALSELQHHAGAMFSAAQGGRPFAHPILEKIAANLRAIGFHGVGQSSWGPTLYAFTDQPPKQFERESAALKARYDLNDDSMIWTTSRQPGAIVRTEP